MRASYSRTQRPSQAQANRAERRKAESTERRSRRHIDREIRRLAKRDVCCLCGEPYGHNVRSFGGLDHAGRVALACEACMPNLAEVHYFGLVSERKYDFMTRSGGKRKAPTNNMRVAEAISIMQKTIGDADTAIERAKRCGGISKHQSIHSMNLLGAAWKDDDRTWFKHHVDRSHRVRLPHPNEITRKLDIPADHELYLIVRQIEPGLRIKQLILLNREVPPLPDDEAMAHALFDAFADNAGSTVVSAAQLGALIEQYSSGGRA